ncbi:O-antigen ligase family protein [Cohnella sp.]|uniref:O-antigen ligase family protein n=1 Tax=Cohnella sp. TaxID=1883426 RepID=UPI003562C867
MNRWSAPYVQPLPLLTLPFSIIAALVIGLAIAGEPVLAAAGVIGVTLFLFSAMSPERMSYVILITSVISIQYLVEIELMGMDMQSLYKIGILLISLPAVIRYGVYRRLSVPILAFMAMVPLTYLFADMHPLLTMSAPLKAFIGLASPFVILMIRWPRDVAELHIRLLCFLPLVSVAFGVMFEVTGVQPLFTSEFTGVLRLQGANIPAHLAFLAFIGFVVCLIEVKRSPHRMTFSYIMMAVNFLILLLTGTRGPLIAALAIILVFLFDLAKQFLKGKTALFLPLVGFIVILVVSVFLQLDNIKKRSFERETESVIDLSGRSEAWAFFIDGVKDSPWFGRGLGSVLVGNDGSLYKGFVVPHNEYIRFYFDGGIVGVTLVFASLLFVFVTLYKRLASGIKLFYIAFILGFLIYSISDNTLSTVQFILPFCAYLNAIGNMSHGNYSAKKGI